MKQIYQHPILGGFSQDEREEIWHAFREKNPNLVWSFSFFGLWVAWSMSWMIAAQYVKQNFVEGVGAAIGVHFFLTLVVGVIGGVMLIGKAMLPKRTKEFHRFLDGKDKSAVLGELGLDHLNSEPVDTQQPAAGPRSKPEGVDQPQPEGEGRSR